MVSESEQEIKPDLSKDVAKHPWSPRPEPGAGESSFRQTAEIDKLAKALAAAQKKIRPAVRNAKNPHFKHDYADLSAVLEAVLPHLAEQGIAVMQGANMKRTIREVSVYEAPRFGNLTTEQASVIGTMLQIEMTPKTDEIEETVVSVTTRLMHESGQWIENECPAVARGSDPQAIAAVITYLKRYGLSAMTGCATGDDDAESNYRRPPANGGGKGKGKDGSAKLAKKDRDAIATAFEKFKVPLTKLEEKLDKKVGAWTEDDRVKTVAIYKDLDGGAAVDEIFGTDIHEPQEVKEEPGSDG